jgi:hypothetical protein
MAQHILQGRAGSSGTGIGRLVRVWATDTPNATTPAHLEPAARQGEQDRLRGALEHAAEQLTQLAEETRARAGVDTAAIFEAQALFAKDPALVDQALAAIAAEGLSAADAIAVAAGTVALAAWIGVGRRRRWLVVAPFLAVEAVALLLALPVILPVRSSASMISSGVWDDSFYKDEIGWPELADQVAGAWRSLPAADRADGAIVAGNYGEASALEYYGESRGLPPVLSGHLSWQYWRPDRLPQRFVLFVGYSRGALSALCRTSRPVATIENRWHLDNEERGRLISTCRLRRPLGELWPQIATDTL